MENVSETITKMIESLPEHLQPCVLDEVRRIVIEKSDEAEWDEQFKRKQHGLVTAAKDAKKDIERGDVEAMDYERL